MLSLAHLIRPGARETQVWVVSHASRLIAALEEDPDCQSITLEKGRGETRIVGQGLLDQPLGADRTFALRCPGPPVGGF